MGANQSDPRWLEARDLCDKILTLLEEKSDARDG